MPHKPFFTKHNHTMKRIALITTGLVLMLSMTLNAQNQNGRFGLELNAGASAATHKLSGTNLHPGFGFEGVIHYRVLAGAGIYAGWGWNGFGSETSFAGNEVDFEETGYVFGIQYQHPCDNRSLGYFLRAGGLYNHIEMENTEGEIFGDTGHGFGWQVAGGVTLPLGRGWSLAPGVRFNSLDREYTTESGEWDLKLRYVSARIGFVKSF